jgi:tetratricopeptide (TPR) repeat protein
LNRKSAANHGDCLSHECLTDYLEGSLDPVVRSAFESHLIACDDCRENLALFMRVLREGVHPHEEAPLQQLDNVWAARKIQPVPAPRRGRLFRRIAYAIAGIAALFLIALFVGKFSLGSKPSVAEQAVAALVERVRPFEPRVVGQSYMAVQEVTRGAEDPVRDVLAAKVTEDPTLAYEVGRYFLLVTKEYDKAIKHLKTAVAAPKGAPADVHNDLGVAYLQSGPANLEDAEVEFKNALELSPTHAPALFNLSLLYSRESRTAEANQRRQEYLALDPDSGWAEEIQRSLEGGELSQP